MSKLSTKAARTAEHWKEGMMGFSTSFRSPSEIVWWRLYIFFGLVGICMLAIVYRLFFLQVIKGQEYVIRSDRNRVYTQYFPADRGVIYDQSGEILARNKPSFSVAVIYNEIRAEDVDSVIQRLSEILSVAQAEIAEGIERSKGNAFEVTTIIPVITHEQQLVIRSQEDALPGVKVIQSTVREYPKGEAFSAVLGYTGIISETEFGESDLGTYTYGSLVGKTGVEYQYEDTLRGTMGKSLLEIEASGKVHAEVELQSQTPGSQIVLSLDATVQQKLFDLLKEKIVKTNAWGGSAIVSNVTTGEIYAMVSLPTFDNNAFGQQDNSQITAILSDSRSLLINRSIGGLYSPGSTVKMAIGAMALERGVVKPNTLISGSPQIITVHGWEFPDWTVAWGRGPHGMMDLPGAIANSSDIFFYKIGGGYPPECGGVSCEVRGLGVDGVVSALRAFGFGRVTGVDLPGENPGLVPDPAWKEKERNEGWFLGNTYHLSIGQGDLLATPIQVLNETNIIATDGATFPPHVLLDRSSDGLFQGAPVEKPVSLDYIKIVREGMVEAVSYGIVFPLRGGVTEVAAKTGTAEFGTINIKGEYATHAWVTGFAPADNPVISFVFMLESGDASQYAAEVAREFTDWYFSEYKR